MVCPFFIWRLGTWDIYHRFKPVGRARSDRWLRWNHEPNPVHKVATSIDATSMVGQSLGAGQNSDRNSEMQRKKRYYVEDSNLETPGKTNNHRIHGRKHHYFGLFPWVPVFRGCLFVFIPVVVPIIGRRHGACFSTRCGSRRPWVARVSDPLVPGTRPRPTNGE